jgi:hypothetical protein
MPSGQSVEDRLFTTDDVQMIVALATRTDDPADVRVGDLIKRLEGEGYKMSEPEQTESIECPNCGWVRRRGIITDSMVEQAGRVLNALSYEADQRLYQHDPASFHGTTPCSESYGDWKDEYDAQARRILEAAFANRS